jgi:hypothetical protein
VAQTASQAAVYAKGLNMIIKGTRVLFAGTKFIVFIDTPNCVLEDRVQPSTVRIPNVIMVKWLKLFKIFLLVFFVL